MTRPVARRSGRYEGGFTLVELLVVLVILAILAAVVVFAVRGSDDKGDQAAKDTDLRTLRTAQEAYCARFGKYAENEAQLVNPSLDSRLTNPGTKGFLSEESTLHDIKPAGPTDPKPCGGTGYILDKERPVDTCEQPPGGSQPGRWCVTEPPPEFTSWEFQPRLLTQLPSGKVLATTTRALLYDPTTENWVEGPPIETSAGIWQQPSNMQLLEDDPATAQSECSSTEIDNCGKVLVLFGGPLIPNSKPGEWFLYDPAQGPTGAWEKVPGPYQPHWGFRTSTVRIAGQKCGPHCGKVLIVGQAETKPPQAPIAELYDPKTNTFEVVGSHAPASGSNMALAPLLDGRVLMVSGDSLAKLFNPTTGAMTDAAPPGFLHPGSQNPLSVLPDGTVLAVGIESLADAKTPAAGIYHPDPSGGPGTWTRVDSCAPTTSGANYDPGCYVLASLADGSVLASRTEGAGRQGFGPSTGIFRFDPGVKKWVKQGSTFHAHTPSYGVLLDAKRGNCAPNCDKVLAVGEDNNTSPHSLLAELYTP